MDCLWIPDGILYEYYMNIPYGQPMGFLGIPYGDLMHSQSICNGFLWQPMNFLCIAKGLYGQLIDFLWIAIVQLMDSLWIAQGLSMHSCRITICIPYGQSMGFPIDSMQIHYRQPMDSLWIVNGYSMDSIQIHQLSPMGSYGSPRITFGKVMDTLWVAYG